MVDTHRLPPEKQIQLLKIERRLLLEGWVSTKGKHKGRADWERLALAIGCTAGAGRQWRGGYRPPRPEHVTKIAELFRVDSAEFEVRRHTGESDADIIELLKWELDVISDARARAIPIAEVLAAARRAVKALRKDEISN